MRNPRAIGGVAPACGAMRYVVMVGAFRRSILSSAVVVLLVPCSSGGADACYRVLLEDLRVRDGTVGIARCAFSERGRPESIAERFGGLPYRHVHEARASAHASM